MKTENGTSMNRVARFVVQSDCAINSRNLYRRPFLLSQREEIVTIIRSHALINDISVGNNDFEDPAHACNLFFFFFFHNRVTHDSSRFAMFRITFRGKVADNIRYIVLLHSGRRSCDIR